MASTISMTFCQDKSKTLAEFDQKRSHRTANLLGLQNHHHHHHHHIHFRALFSSTEGWAFLTSLSRRRPLHSERFWESVESIPSFFLSFSSTSSHDFLGLPDLFCATTFSLRTSAIQPVLRSTCPNHLILLVRSTTSKSWMPSFVRRESELTSSFALTLQIQRIMARSLRRKSKSLH